MEAIFIPVSVRIDEIMRDPSTSEWLKYALRWALNRDPVDVAADAELLHWVLHARAEALFQAQSECPKNHS